jgi:hypothetical protein
LVGVSRLVGGALILLAAGLWLGLGGWPGSVSGCVAAGDCGCEAIGAGLFAQPANALSSTFLIAAGLTIAAVIPRSRNPGPLSSERALAFGAVVVLAGVASILYHASLREWAGWADLVGTGGVLVFAIVHRSSAAGTRGFNRLLLAGVAGVALLMAVVGTASGKYVLIALAAYAVLVEGAVIWQQRRAASLRWLTGAAIAYLLATAAWWLGRSESTWCEPTSRWQWHSLWHVLAAAALVALAQYWGNERATDAPP